VLNQHDIDLDEAGQQFLRIAAKSFACGLPWPSRDVPAPELVK
jgi:hypothetical protein